MNTCVRCGVSTPELIITKGNTGPICRGCLKLYAKEPEKWCKFPKLDKKRDSYGFLSFTGQTRAGPFWLQILSGRKTQTIREPRSDGRPHVITGLETTLYWKVRDTRKKLIHKIGVAKVLAYEEVRLIDLLFDEQNALADGFSDLDEFRLWFFPEWFDLPDLFKETIKSSAQLNNEVIINVSRNAGRGKNRLREILQEITQPMRRIKFEVIERNAVPICPRCKGIEYRVEEFSMIRCVKCGELHYPDELEWTDPAKINHERYPEDGV